MATEEARNEQLVREFLTRFPTERIEELADAFEQARAIELRLNSLSLSVMNWSLYGEFWRSSTALASASASSTESCSK